VEAVSKKAKKEPVVPHNYFWCEQCGTHEMSVDEFKVHIKEKHGINDTQGTRRMLMHADGDTWFSYRYEWTIGGMKFTQSTLDRRCAEDQMYWDANE
jgi:hypothetical protein